MTTKATITIATPMYGAQCTGPYLKSLLNTFIVAGADNYQIEFLDLYNESLVTRARNTLTHMFLQTESDYLLFIDADQTFRWEDIKRMVEHDKDIIAAPVAMKKINWNMVGRAARAGVEDEQLQFFTGYFNLNLDKKQLSDEMTLSVNDPNVVKYAGTGMILIKRGVFDQINQFVDSYSYDGVSMPRFNIIQGETQIGNYWDTAIVDGRLLSEDYYFSSLWHKTGGQVFVDLKTQVVHIGSYAFNGSMLAQLPTEDSGSNVSGAVADKQPTTKPAAKKPAAKKPAAKKPAAKPAATK